MSKRNTAGLVVMLLAGAMLPGCGASDGGGGNPVPVGATVQVNPSAIQWEIGNGDPCVIDPAVYNDHTVAISVLNSSGAPLGNVDIRVMADLSGNTFSGTDVIKVYDDLNGNGVIDDPAELVSSNTSPSFITKTAQYSGTRIVLVRVNLSCPYRGNLHVFAGAAYGSTNIEVTQRPPPPAP